MPIERAFAKVAFQPPPAGSRTTIPTVAWFAARSNAVGESDGREPEAAVTDEL
jgi:hypothetical protein